ncbi:agmatine deiminase [Rhodothermus profundi]|uniref:Agmatine deiminase n=2 Tax=Rhodothermus profundi TaxID=633813 RepID=A0A1M6P6C7_9BACT|nr:agmatine deiminase family protein [Rhodothermus profundi]SHK03531.1 agmatine deiminase [Rhodothermus profundi]
MPHLPAASWTPTVEPTPAARGFRMPPEWAPHRATWLSWPHNRETWPDELEQVERTIAQVVRLLSRREAVYINVNDAAHEQHVRRLLDEAGVCGPVRFFHIPTDDAWIRDYGALFVVHPQQRTLAATVWGFNSWGGKYPPWDRDARVARRMAEALNVPIFEGAMILEGGSIDTNGAGVLLTTEQCLLNPNRNPHLNRSAIEQRLQDFLGIRQILWLGQGLAGDDTDGHVDDLTRFVAEDVVVTVVETNPQDPNYDPLQDNLERLRAFRFSDGRPLQIVELPMPAPLEIAGERVPATYANFYIANELVLMPAYGDVHDEKAQQLLQQCFPDRTVVPIDCRAIIRGLGALHCLTQQVPAL